MVSGWSWIAGESVLRRSHISVSLHQQKADAAAKQMQARQEKQDRRGRQEPGETFRRQPTENAAQSATPAMRPKYFLPERGSNRSLSNDQKLDSKMAPSATTWMYTITIIAERYAEFPKGPLT